MCLICTLVLLIIVYINVKKIKKNKKINIIIDSYYNYNVQGRMILRMRVLLYIVVNLWSLYNE